MISPECFQQGMTIIADRYGRALKAPTQRVYFERLSQELNDAQFIAGVMLAIDAPFMPSPGDIVKAAKPPVNFTIEAEDAWNEIVQSCRAMPWQMIPRDRFSDVWWKAIAASGGIKAIALAEPHDAPHVHRRFVEHYARLQSDRAANQRADLAQGRATVPLETMDGQVQQLVRDTAKQIGGAR